MIYICKKYDFNENTTEINLINHGEKNHYKKNGFYNIGNSCYINSFLQILFNIPNFIENLKKEYKAADIKSIFIRNLIDLSETNNVKYLYSIQDYMKNISSNYSLFLQGDSQIFGIDLLDEIINNIKVKENDIEDDSEDNSLKIQIKNKKMEYKNYIKKYQKNEISIEKMFLINESLTISQNNNINYRFSTNLDIELVFPKNKKGVYTLKELLCLKYNINNKNCTKDIDFSNYKFLKIKRGICKFPLVLIITISRSFIGNELNCSSLEFPEELDLSQFMDYDLVREKQNLKYTLFAINEKIGYNKQFGHYICKIKEKDKWYKYNDIQVKEIFTNFNKQITSKNVVGLFYIKK